LTSPDLRMLEGPFQQFIANAVLTTGRTKAAQETQVVAGPTPAKPTMSPASSATHRPPASSFRENN